MEEKILIQTTGDVHAPNGLSGDVVVCADGPADGGTSREEQDLSAENASDAETDGPATYPAMADDVNGAPADDEQNPIYFAELTADELNLADPSARPFQPSSSESWYSQAEENANRSYLDEYFRLAKIRLPRHTYALIAPITSTKGGISMQYYSYRDTAFEYSMTPDGEENYWPASTVKLAAAVMALLKLKQYGTGSQAIVDMTDVEGNYNDTVEKLCRDAIIPSNNTAYNRLMEIAGFDEINDYYLRRVFHFPRMVLQRRYVRIHPTDSLRDSPEIQFVDGEKTGMIPERHSSGVIRPECPREANCTTLAELAEVMFRVVLHEELPANRRLALDQSEIDMLRSALLKAPSCIGSGVAEAMGSSAIIYNKGGKVIGDDRLEVAVVSSPDYKERYLVALSMPYYEGVEKETNALAKHLIRAMQLRKQQDSDKGASSPR